MVLLVTQAQCLSRNEDNEVFLSARNCAKPGKMSEKSTMGEVNV